MRKFRTLLALQMRGKYNLGFTKSHLQMLFKVIWTIIGFAIVTAVAYLVLFLCQRLTIFSAVSQIPTAVMNVVLTVILFLNLLTCTVGLSKTLYQSPDNQVLVTYPVNPNLLFLSKMLIYYLAEYRKAFNFVIPIFVAYGLISHSTPLFFLWLPLMFILLTAVPVLLGGLLSIPMHYVLRYLNRYLILKTVLFAAAIIAIAFGFVHTINLIPSNINLIRIWGTVAVTIRRFLATFTNIFWPLYAVTTCLCGTYQQLTLQQWTTYSWQVPLILMVLIVVLTAINMVTARPLYLKMITKDFEFNKAKAPHPRPNRALPPLWAACVYETKRHLRNQNITAVTIGTLIIAPITMLLVNRIYAAINTRLLGDYLTIAFNVLILCLFSLAHNINVSSVYSRDGAALPLNKTKPQRPCQVILPKLTYNAVTSLIILWLSTSIFLSFANLSVWDSIGCVVMLTAVMFTHLLWSAEFDFLHPNTNGNHKSETKSIILCFGLSAVVFGLTFFFLNDVQGRVWLKLSCAAVALLALRLSLFARKVNALYREVA
ncbi:MAG: hypothetical protein NC133_04425 [Prevotella sp.]|nr:hypothetical protein [Prevotella sp.]